MKDTPEAIEFLAAFQKLLALDLEPRDLVSVAKDDDVIREVCKKVHRAGWSLIEGERRHPELYASPVDPKFIDSWRDYQERFEEPVIEVWLSNLDEIGRLFLADEASTSFESPSRSNISWDRADKDACERANAIERAIEFAFNEVTGDPGGFSDGFPETIEHAVELWDQTKETTGLDLRGIFRRRQLTPFVLIPRQIASKYGNEKLSLFTHLQQAHQAFIFGAPLAASSLMRSVMEVVLRDHYGASGDDHEKLIDGCPSLPRGASKPALHRLRKMSNAILHFNTNSRALPENLNGPEFEIELVSLLLVLRALIEGAPIRKLQ